MIKCTKSLSVPAMILGMGLLLCACKGNSKTSLREQRNDRESYSLGYQTGQNLKRQKVDVNLDIYVSAIRDALEGKESQLTPNEMRAALSEMAQKIRTDLQTKSAAMAEKNLAESKAFLEENKGKEGVQVLPSGLQYKILKQGNGKKPGPNDTVTVDYRGSLLNGTEFASSYKQKKPQTANLSRTIPGWKEALQLMKEGSKWQLVVPPELAYGPRGTTGIEPNRALIFDVELLSVTPVMASNQK